MAAPAEFHANTTTRKKVILLHNSAIFTSQITCVVYADILFLQLIPFQVLFLHGLLTDHLLKILGMLII